MLFQGKPSQGKPLILSLTSVHSQKMCVPWLKVNKQIDFLKVADNLTKLLIYTNGNLRKAFQKKSQKAMDFFSTGVGVGGSTPHFIAFGGVFANIIATIPG